MLTRLWNEVFRYMVSESRLTRVWIECDCIMRSPRCNYLCIEKIVKDKSKNIEKHHYHHYRSQILQKEHSRVMRKVKSSKAFWNQCEGRYPFYFHRLFTVFSIIGLHRTQYTNPLPYLKVKWKEILLELHAPNSFIHVPWQYPISMHRALLQCRGVYNLRQAAEVYLHLCDL